MNHQWNQTRSSPNPVSCLPSLQWCRHVTTAARRLWSECVCVCVFCHFSVWPCPRRSWIYGEFSICLMLCVRSCSKINVGPRLLRLHCVWEGFTVDPCMFLYCVHICVCVCAVFSVWVLWGCVSRLIFQWQMDYCDLTETTYTLWFTLCACVRVCVFVVYLLHCLDVLFQGLWSSSVIKIKMSERISINGPLPCMLVSF